MFEKFCNNLPTETRNPLYSCPHFSLMITGLPVNELRNGFGLIGIAILKRSVINKQNRL